MSRTPTRASSADRPASRDGGSGRNTPRNSSRSRTNTLTPHAVLAAFEQRKTSNRSTSSAGGYRPQQSTTRKARITSDIEASQASTASYCSGSSGLSCNSITLPIRYSQLGRDTSQALHRHGISNDSGVQFTRHAHSNDGASSVASGSRTARSPRHVTIPASARSSRSGSARSIRSSRPASSRSHVTSSVGTASPVKHLCEENRLGVMPGCLHRSNAEKPPAINYDIGAHERTGHHFGPVFERRFDNAGGKPTWTSMMTTRTKGVQKPESEAFVPPTFGIKVHHTAPLDAAKLAARNCGKNRDVMLPGDDGHLHIDATTHTGTNPSRGALCGQDFSTHLAGWAGDGFAGHSSWFETGIGKEHFLLGSRANQTSVDEIVFGHKLCPTSMLEAEQKKQQVARSTERIAGEMNPTGENNYSLKELLQQSSFVQWPGYRTSKKSVHRALSDSSYTYPRPGKKNIKEALGKTSFLRAEAFGRGCSQGGTDAPERAPLLWRLPRDDKHYEQRRQADPQEEREQVAGLCSGPLNRNELKRLHDIDAFTKPSLSEKYLTETKRAASEDRGNHSHESRRQRPLSAPPGGIGSMQRRR